MELAIDNYQELLNSIKLIKKNLILNMFISIETVATNSHKQTNNKYN